MKNQFTSAVQRIRVRSRAFTGRHLHPSGDRGIALILTLAIITLVTVLLIAFATSMRVENTASKNFNDLIKSRELAQAAVDQAVATIRQYTTRNAAPDNILNYVTFPGAIYYFDGATTFRKPLYSQHAAGAISTASAPDPFDFNYAVDNVLWITGKGGEFPPGAASEFPVGWVYVAEDGSLAPPLPVPLPRNIVGRFAFWVDDEASKINLNTAGTPTVTTPPPPPPPDFGHSVSNDVDLSVLLGGMGASVAAIKGIQASPGFTTIEEVKLADPSDLDFNANRFSLTTYSSDANYPNYTDDLDAFGQQRRPLSGAGAVSQPTDIADTITINSAYKRMSDPLTLGKMYSGSTFDAKYGANGLKQIIANIISYQLDPTSTTLAPATDGLTPPGYLGLAKTPYLNEVNIAYNVIDNGDGTFSASRTISVELYYIYSDVTFNSQAGDTITVSALPDSVPSLFSPPPAIPVNGAFLSGGLPRFFTVTQTVPLPLTRVLQPPAGHTIVTYSRGANRLDYSEMDFPQVRLEIGNPGTTIQDVEVDDPAVNDTFNQWTPSSGNGTLGSLNDPSVYKPMDGTVPTGGLPPPRLL
jgi:nitrogen fixation protein FixH